MRQGLSRRASYFEDPKRIFRDAQSMRDFANLVEEAQDTPSRTVQDKVAGAKRSAVKYLDRHLDSRIMHDFFHASFKSYIEGVLDTDLSLMGIFIPIFTAVAGTSRAHAVNYFRSLLLAQTLEVPPTTTIMSVSENLLLHVLLYDFAANWPGRGLISSMPTKATGLLFEAALDDESAKAVVNEILVFLEKYKFHLRPTQMLPVIEAEERNRYTYWNAPDSYLRYILKRQEEIEESGPDTISELILSKYDAFAALLEELWAEIAGNARRDIRPDGLDAYRIVGELFDQSERYFFHADLAFPEVGMVMRAKLLDKDHYYTSILAPESLEAFLLRNGAEALAYLGNLIAYHQIVCAAPRSADTRTGGRREASPGVEVNVQRIRETVRAHMHRLHPGWNPSQQKQEEYYRLYQRELPAGYTWYSAGDRERIIVYGSQNRQTGEGPGREILLKVDPLKVLMNL